MDDYKNKYEHALENLKKIKAANKDNKELVDFIEYEYPELKESEDERARKEIIAFLTYYHTGQGNRVVYNDDWISWLKKQEDANKEYWRGYREGKQEILDKYAELEKQGEQKPTDKVEPKSDIEKGKWYVCNTPRYRDFIVGKAYYCPKNGMLKPNENAMARYVARHCFHLWTIQDAKEGDVLYYKSPSGIEYIVMSSGVNKFGNVDSYFRYNSVDGFGISVPSVFNTKEDITPATKKQRDLLFQEMKEAGYKWDAEKKELKKIEQKPAWSEEDEKMFNNVISTLEPLSQTTHSGYAINSMIDWLKSLKERTKGE